MTDPSRSPVFWIQIQPTSGPVSPEMEPSKFIKATRETLAQVSTVIEETCEVFIAKVEALDSKPTEIGIEFGIDASGEAGIPLVTKGSLGANFKVTFKWVW